MRAGLGLAFIAALQAGAVTVTVTHTTEYQTIEGFGFFDNITPWTYRSGPFYITINLDSIDFWGTLANDLGASMVRFEVPPGYYPSAGTYNLNAQDGLSLTAAQQFAHANKFKAKGLNRFIYTVWSPPCWMKVGDICNNGTALESQYYGEFSDMLVHFGQEFKTTTNLDLYGISPQNESKWVEPYNSCVYTPTQLRDLVKILGPKVDVGLPATRIYYAEHMGWDFGYFENTVRSDAAALAAVDRWSFHGYSDGVAADPNSYTGVTATDKSIWMTETSGFTNWLDMAMDIHNCLYHAKVSAWVHWAIAGNFYDNSNGNKTDLWYAAKHFYRYIRPDAKMVAATSSDANVAASAYTHTGNSTQTLVLINRNTSAATINLSGLSGTFTIYQSTGITKDQNAGTVSGSGSFTMPASSIVTLYNGNITNTIRPQIAPATSSKMVNAASYRLHTLDGRSVSSVDRSVAPGAVIAVPLNADGKMINNVRVIVK